MKTRITDLFGIQYPIIQGAMQWLSKPKLAAAVSNAGGLGTINMTTYDTPEAFQQDIQLLKTLTDKPFCVNLSLLPGYQARRAPSRAFSRPSQRKRSALWRPPAAPPSRLWTP